MKRWTSLVFGVTMAACAAASPSAWAQLKLDGSTLQNIPIDNRVTLTLDGNTGNPVTGGDPARAFHMNFLLDDARRLSAGELGSTRDFEISLTSPNTAAFRFMFSPRAQFGLGFDPVAGTNRAYAALTWDLFSFRSLFGHVGIASSFDPAGSGFEARRGDEAPLMFHGALEFGYRLDQENSLLLAIDQGVAPGVRGPAAEPDNFMLRFGRKF